MKRFIGFLLDTVFYISFLFSIGVIGIFLIYTYNQDISILNVFLQTKLIESLLIVYGAIVLCTLVYDWIIPYFIGQTLGQKLMGNMYDASGKPSLFAVFMKSFIGKFWDILLFPYSIFAGLTKRDLISKKLSGITVINDSKDSKKSGLYAVTIVFVLFLVSTLGIGTYIYKTGIGPIMERYTDYKKQTESLVASLAYQDAANALLKYKQYHGEDADYSYYHCIIEANLDTSLDNLPLCKTASDTNAGNPDRQQAILLLEAKVYAANSDYTQAETFYATLWNEKNLRTLEMKDYVVVLSELGKNKEAAEVLTEVAKLVQPTDTVAMRDIALLYERVGNLDAAAAQLQVALGTVKDGSNQDLAGELNYYIGVIQYKKGKYTDAKASFEAAKTLNKDYSEPADSYIILISKLAKSVTK